MSTGKPPAHAAPLPDRAGGPQGRDAVRRVPGLLGAITATSTPAGTHRVILRLTYPLTGAVVGFALLSRVAGANIPYWLIATLAVFMLALTAAEARVVHRGQIARFLGGLHLGVALLVLTVGITFSGGVESPFVWTFGLVMAVEGILRGRRWALISAAACTGLLLAATLFVRSGGIPYNEGNLWSPRTTVAFYISYVGMFFTVAFATSLLGGHLRGQTREIAALAEETRDGYLGTIRALADTIEARNTDSAGYSRRLEHRAREVSHRLGLSNAETETIAIAAILRDISKIGIPDAVLQDAGELDADEVADMQRHVEIGAAILARVPYLSEVARIVRHHHERFDGTGYPDHLAGEAIPLGSRILAVVDAYETMTSERPDREAFTPWVAVNELRADAGSDLDPKIVEAFVNILAAETRG